MPTPEDCKRLLGEKGASHLPVLDKLISQLANHHRYDFMSAVAFDELGRSDPQEWQKVYWLEILYRAHFAAYTSLLRTSRWLSAMFAASDANNYTAFLAAYRGCLEAAADSYDTFEHIPMWLADLSTVIKEIIEKRTDLPYIFKDLEDKLIHFTHARYVTKGEVVADTIRVKQTKQYLQKLIDTGLPEVDECYRELCDVTHPGIGSVRCYAEVGETDTGTWYRLRADLDQHLIGHFCTNYQSVTERMMSVSVFHPVITLRILNEFNIDAVHTKTVETLGVEQLPVWTDFAQLLASPSPQLFKTRP